MTGHRYGGGGLASSSQRYGDCPVCERRMLVDELTEHAAGCQVNYNTHVNTNSNLSIRYGSCSWRVCFCCRSFFPQRCAVVVGLNAHLLYCSCHCCNLTAIVVAPSQAVCIRVLVQYRYELFHFILHYCIVINLQATH